MPSWPCVVVLSLLNTLVFGKAKSLSHRCALIVDRSIHDAILSRLSNDDDMERNLSTFASEMASSAMILGLATEDTLVLVDELGRGTSPTEGLGISHAIAERLVEIKVWGTLILEVAWAKRLPNACSVSFYSLRMGAM